MSVVMLKLDLILHLQNIYLYMQLPRIGRSYMYKVSRKMRKIRKHHSYNSLVICLGNETMVLIIIKCLNKGTPVKIYKIQTFCLHKQELRDGFDREARLTGNEPLLLTAAVSAERTIIDNRYDVPKLTE